MKYLSKNRTAVGFLTISLLLSTASATASRQADGNTDKLLGVLLAVGDIAKCGTAPRYKNDEKVAGVVNNAVAMAKKQGVPIKLILLGDLAYPNGTSAQFENCFDPGWGQWKNIMLPVPGNHEYDPKKDGEYNKKDGQQLARPYFEYFKEEPKDFNGKALVSAVGERAGYYALRFPDPAIGPWLLFSLNPYTKAEVKPDWKTWLKNELLANEQLGTRKSPCILAFAHPYRFSSGFHGHNDDRKNADAKTVKGESIKSAYSILLAHRASVLLGGHDHHFEQFSRQDVDGNKTKDGIRTFIVGTGGGTLYLQNLKNKYKIKYTIAAANQELPIIGDKFGILKINLYKNKYSWVFLPTEGEPILPDIHQDSCNLE